MPTGLPSQWCLPACPFMSKSLTTYHTVCLCTLYVLMYIIMYTYWICYACIMWVHYTLHYTTLSKCCTFTWAICGAVVPPVYILYNTHLVRHQLGMGIVQHILNLFCSEVLLNCMMDRGRGGRGVQGRWTEKVKDMLTSGSLSVTQPHKMREGGRNGWRRGKHTEEETGTDHEAFEDHMADLAPSWQCDEICLQSSWQYSATQCKFSPVGPEVISAKCQLCPERQTLHHTVCA